MDYYISLVEQFIRDHQDWAGPIIALITLGESLIVVGLFIPATALLIMTGGLLGSGTLPITPILLWAILGAVVGDALSYLLGRWAGPRVVHRWPLRQQRAGVARARLFFYRYGFLSILVGRFLGPIRSTIPTVAGMMRMNHLSFQSANVLSAILWVPLMFAPGYLAARSLGAIQNGQHATLLIGTILSVSVGAWLLFTLLRKRRQGPRKP